MSTTMRLPISTEMLRKRTAHARLSDGRIQNDGVSQSPSIPQGGGFKVFDARGRKIFLREYLKKLFRSDVRYVSSAPERGFVTTYGTSVRRKRVNRDLSKISTWCNLQGMRLNPNKTLSMIVIGLGLYFLLTLIF